MVAIAHPTVFRLPEITYRRRRLAAVGLLLVVLSLALALVTTLTAGRADGGPEPVATVTYVVQPGDSLWSIAGDLAPGTDLRPVVDALAAANGGPALVPGQRLVVDLP